VAFLACTAALGGLLFGFDGANVTGAGPFICREFALTDFGLGWAFSSLLFGCVIGSFVVGRISDRYEMFHEAVSAADAPKACSICSAASHCLRKATNELSYFVFDSS
jgi:MFS family permease